ncbi:MAG: hydrogenase iron-sulfur subunit [Candidatus Lokiarchaeota archaeon]|nr:hydrogenase iron-sulfur subunit [Candidatus Lokiarchaeota archaeon]
MDIYEVLSHPIRRKLLLILEREGYLKHSELMDKLAIDKTGILNFHLKQLDELVSKETKTKAYCLSEMGKAVIRIIDLNERLLKGEELPAEVNKKGEISRVGVITCNCTGEVSDCLDINALDAYARKITGVVSTRVLDNLCQEKYLKSLHQWCRDNFINKLVIAACSPKTHQHVFEAMFDGVVDRPNIEIVNIREQCAWVHRDDSYRDATLKKAEILIEAGAARVGLQRAIKVKTVQVEKSCAVIGGGIAGMTLALSLARAGMQVHLIDKAPTLGGMAARWNKIQGMADCSICFISEMIGEIKKQKSITIHTNTKVDNISGEIGNFTLDLTREPRFVDVDRCTGCGRCTHICKVEKPDQYEYGLAKRKLIYIPFSHAYPFAATIDKEDLETCKACRICERACINKAIALDQEPEKLRLKVGAKVIAIGAELHGDLASFHHDPSNDVVTAPEFERILSSDGPTGGELLRLSNDEPPKAVAYIQGIGPRSASGLDGVNQSLDKLLARKYEAAVKEQVPKASFKTFPARTAKVEVGGGEKRVVDSSAKAYKADLIILGTEVVPNPDLKDLRKKFDFTLDDHGFMGEETLSSGIFGVGAVLGPRSYNEVVFGANKVALDVIALLSRETLVSDYTGAENNQDKCGLCGLCARSCPYNAIVLTSDRVVVDKFKCKSCGTCASVCPTGAMELNVDSTDKIRKSIEVMAKLKESPKILAFCCRSCGYAAADDAGLKRLLYSPSVLIIRVPCSGRVDSNFLVAALEAGFDGVMVIGCKQDACRYIDGFYKAKQKVRLLQQVLGEDGAGRIMIESMSAVEGNKFAEVVTGFYNKLKEGTKH